MLDWAENAAREKRLMSEVTLFAPKGELIWWRDHDLTLRIVFTPDKNGNIQSVSCSGGTIAECRARNNR